MAGSQPPEIGESLAAAILDGSYREKLEALASQLAVAFDQSPPGAKAQTAAQLRAVLKDLEQLPDGKKMTKADELAHRRAARLAAADADVPTASGGGK